VADVFLSYAREDHDVTGRLARLFALEGWSCWWDPEIALGDDFRPLVAEQVGSAVVVVVLWSQAARASTWVAWETEHAQAAGKLVELTLPETADPASGVRDGALVISHNPLVPPMRDAVLAHVARGSGLRRRCDGWNARLRATAWRSRPPKWPIIAYEIRPPNPPDLTWAPIDPGLGSIRIVRRERWATAATVEYGTTIGNGWIFGYEGAHVSIGWLFITQGAHTIQLPKRDRSAERHVILPSRVIPFNLEPSIADIIEGHFFFPGGGVPLSQAR
jgi:hypothetical protein